MLLGSTSVFDEPCEQTKRPPEDAEQEEVHAAQTFSKSIISPAASANFLLKVSNMVNHEVFEVPISGKEDIVRFRLSIEESQKIPFDRQIIMYNGRAIDE